jgi:molecular chaperone HscB
VLRLSKSYFLDDVEVERAYRKISRQVHPDRFVKSPAVIRRMALQWMAAINGAREVVLSPTKRARWLATGVAEPEEEKMSRDTDFLEQVFELQSLRTSSPEKAETIIKNLIESLENQLSECFQNHESGKNGLELVVDILDKLQYLHKTRS